MALTVAHKNIELNQREAEALQLWEKVLAPKWDAKLRAEAEVFLSPEQERKKKERVPPDRA